VYWDACGNTQAGVLFFKQVDICSLCPSPVQVSRITSGKREVE
jgi:hypothetical protein